VSSAPFQLAPLDATHDRTTFNSASEPLDRYFREHVTQDVRRRVAACFVALAARQRIAGYYTLASASLLLADLPANTGKKLPRYPTVPAVRMGRLAVDQGFKGQGARAERNQEALICPSRPWYAVLSPPESGAQLSLEPARPHRFLGCAQYVAAGS
jgi:hypothetical protein